jgi:hypothetical protein
MTGVLGICPRLSIGVLQKFVAAGSDVQNKKDRMQ